MSISKTNTHVHVHIDVTRYTFALLVSGEVTALYRSYGSAEEALQIFGAMHPGEFDLAVIDAITGEVLWTN